MDRNKLKVLREVGYQFSCSCETCVHSDLSPDGWGYCNVHTYQHLKHSEVTSRLSIHRLGGCGQWDKDPQKWAKLGLGAFEDI